MDISSSTAPRLRRRLGMIGAAVLTIAAGGVALAPEALAVTKLSQSQAQSQLGGAGITHSSSGNCTDRYNAHCTSYEQINQATVSGAITLHRASGCAVNITGGTETGHANGTYSHWNGYKVDIARSTCNDNWIRGTYTYIGLRADGYPMYQAASGNVYTNEGSHWDIVYYTCGC
jgi:hypothetical protein